MNLNGYSDLSAVEGIVQKGGWGMGMRRYTWSSSRREKQRARLCGEKVNNEKDIKVNRLMDSE